MNVITDLMTRSLAQLANDPVIETEARRRYKRFADALRRLEADPREAARVDAIVIEAEQPTYPTAVSPDVTNFAPASLGETFAPASPEEIALRRLTIGPDRAFAEHGHRATSRRRRFVVSIGAFASIAGAAISTTIFAVFSGSVLMATLVGTSLTAGIALQVLIHNYGPGRTTTALREGWSDEVLSTIVEDGSGGPAAAVSAADELLVRIRHLHRGIERVADELVIGPHGQNLTVRVARAKERQLAARIEMEQVTGSLRHHRVRPMTRLLAILAVAVVDFPIMLWPASSVFNVDWAHPLGVPLVISAVVSLLATGGAAVALVHLGHNQRQHKNDRRQLDWRALSAGGKASLATVGLLVGLMGVLIAVRVDTEGAQVGLAGQADLAALLAVLVAVVLVVSALLVFWTAFRDGSLELDELRHYSGCVRPHLLRRREWEDKVAELTCQYDLLCQRVERERLG